MDTLKHRLTNTCHRLHWATEGLGHTPPCTKAAAVVTYKLLPGGGRTEAACIHMLEEKAREEDKPFDSYNSPLYFTSGWMSNKLVLGGAGAGGGWRRAVYQAFANGLRRYLVRGVMNSRPDLSVFEAMSQAEGMVRQQCGGREDCVGVANSKERVWHCNCGGVEDCEVLDVAVSKKEAWHKAVHLLETLFLSKRVDLKH